MPKLKTNKAMKKRFRVTKKGKVIGSRSLRRHMMVDRTPKNKRQARLGLGIEGPSAEQIKMGLPYDK